MATKKYKPNSKFTPKKNKTNSKFTPKKNKKKNRNKNRNKRKIAEQVIFGLKPKIVNSIIQALDRDNKIQIKRLVAGLDEYDIAHLIETLNYSRRKKLVEFLGDGIAPDVFPELHDVVQEQIIDTLDEKQIVNIVNELDSDDAVGLLENLDDDDQESVINKLNPELKSQVKKSLAHPEDSAGRIMSRDFVSMPDNWTVQQAKEFLLTSKNLPEDFFTIFLVDDKFHPTGVIPLDTLLRTKAVVRLKDIMDGDLVPIGVDTDQEEVAHMFREYGWISAVVVDAKEQLVGVINIDDVVHIVHEEASEDIMHLSGAGDGDVYKSVFSIFKSRSIWLIMNLFATILASSVVQGFQDVIAQVAVLAVLMPIVASMGGTTGQQTLAVVVRAIATKELTSRNTLTMIGKEFLVGLYNGALFAGLIALVTYLRFPDYQIMSVIIAVAMLCNLAIASLAGILIPLTLNRLKADPAVSSGVFLIAITDSGGFFIFLGLAKLFLF